MNDIDNVIENLEGFGIKEDGLNSEKPYMMVLAEQAIKNLREQWCNHYENIDQEEYDSDDNIIDYYNNDPDILEERMGRICEIIYDIKGDYYEAYGVELVEELDEDEDDEN